MKVATVRGSEIVGCKTVLEEREFKIFRKYVGHERRQR
jgi:hypothetical protein